MLPMRGERTTTNTEDRATQPMETGGWVSQFFGNIGRFLRGFWRHSWSTHPKILMHVTIRLPYLHTASCPSQFSKGKSLPVKDIDRRTLDKIKAFTKFSILLKFYLDSFWCILCELSELCKEGRIGHNHCFIFSHLWNIARIANAVTITLYSKVTM